MYYEIRCSLTKLGTKFRYLASTETNRSNQPKPLAPKIVVKQQYLRFGIACGIVGSLLLGCSPSAKSLPPLQIAKPSVTAPTIITSPRGQKLPVSATMTIGGQTILLEVARTNQEQATGLMYRTDLPKDRGMWFVFNPPRPVKFWMKNTLIPLDMLFVSNGVVKYIGADIPSCKVANCPSYGPEQNVDVDGVIELRSGTAAALKIKVGDPLKVDLIQPKGVNR